MTTNTVRCHTVHVQAIRDMTDDGKHPTNKPQGADDCQARAAQVLAAVVSGLTSTPQALGNKHRANRGARSAGTDADSATAVANPAIQKIRDYQLQVTSQHGHVGSRQLLIVNRCCSMTPWIVVRKYRGFNIGTGHDLLFAGIPPVYSSTVDACM